VHESASYLGISTLYRLPDPARETPGHIQKPRRQHHAEHHRALQRDPGGRDHAHRGL